MKLVARTLALSLVITGIAAGAYSRPATSTTQVVPAVVPVPNCPLDSPGCGIWK